MSSMDLGPSAKEGFTEGERGGILRRRPPEGGLKVRRRRKVFGRRGLKGELRGGFRGGLRGGLNGGLKEGALRGGLEGSFAGNNWGKGGRRKGTGYVAWG